MLALCSTLQKLIIVDKSSFFPPICWEKKNRRIFIAYITLTCVCLSMCVCSGVGGDTNMFITYLFAYRAVTIAFLESRAVVANVH